MIKFSILFVKFYLRIFANKSIHKTFAGGCLSRCFLLAAGTGDPVRTREIAADESAGAGTHGVLTLRVLCRRAFNDAAEKPADGRGGCQAALVRRPRPRTELVVKPFDHNYYHFFLRLPDNFPGVGDAVDVPGRIIGK